MALVDTGLFYYPPPIAYNAARSPSHSSSVLDAAGEMSARLDRSWYAGNLAIVRFYVHTFTTGGDLEVRIEGISDTTGDPDGALVTANANVTVTISATGWVTATLTAAAVLALNQKYAVVLKNTTGNYAIRLVDPGMTTDGFPLGDHFTASWAKVNVAPVMVLEYSGSVYPQSPRILPGAYANAQYDTGDSPDEIGAHITMPFGGRAIGCWYYGGRDDGNFDIIFYDSANAILAQAASQDKDLRFSTSGASFWVPFSSSGTFTKDGVVRLVRKPLAGVGNEISQAYLDLPSAAARSQLPAGSHVQYTGRADAGAWTQTDTRYPLMGLVINGIDLPIAIPVGMEGGMVG